MCSVRLAGAGPAGELPGVRARSLRSFLLDEDGSGRGWRTGQVMKKQLLSAQR